MSSSKEKVLWILGANFQTRVGKAYALLAEIKKESHSERPLLFQYVLTQVNQVTIHEDPVSSEFLISDEEFEELALKYGEDLNSVLEEYYSEPLKKNDLVRLWEMLEHYPNDLAKSYVLAKMLDSPIPFQLQFGIGIGHHRISIHDYPEAKRSLVRIAELPIAMCQKIILLQRSTVDLPPEVQAHFIQGLCEVGIIEQIEVYTILGGEETE